MPQKLLRISMTLLSDTIFGSGYSIPGGEDIAVKTDSHGYPYLSGNTVKGLLREEVGNWLDWTDDSSVSVDELFGRSDLTGAASERRIFTSELTLRNPPKNCLDCFSTRTFTSIGDDRVADSGTLRVASCIHKGFVFDGYIICSDADSELVRNAVQCIKYVGTSRTRGFGHVRMEVTSISDYHPQAFSGTAGSGNVLCYRLLLQQPVRITDRNSSHDTLQACCDHIPASSMRGVVMARLSKENPEWFNENKVLLLKALRFSDAVPQKHGSDYEPVIPTPSGFYEDKLGNAFYHILAGASPDVKPGTKRAAMKTYAVLDADAGTITTHGASMHQGSRVNLKEAKLFQTAALDAGQYMTGSVTLPDDAPDALRQKLFEALSTEFYLGADTHSGYGLCMVDSLSYETHTPEQACGYTAQDPIPGTLFMLLLTPTALTDQFGESCGINTENLGELLGQKVRALSCSSSVTIAHGFNRTLGAKLPDTVMYSKGSIFKIEMEQPAAYSVLQKLELQGIGIRREEGYGRVLFLKGLEKITGRAQSNQSMSVLRSTENEQNNRQLQWRSEHPLPEGLSTNQRSDLEMQLRSQMDDPDAVAAMTGWFRHIMEKGADVEAAYRATCQFVMDTLQDESVPAEGLPGRIKLIADMIQISRRGN